MKKHFYGLCALLLAMALPAFAQDNASTYSEHDEHHAVSPGGLFLEPIVQASKADTNIRTGQLPLLGDTSGNADGYGLGLKLGVHVSEMFWLGLDGRYDRLHLTDSSYGTADGDAYNWGPTAGLQMPIAGLRLMATYVTGGQFDPGSGTSGVDTRFRDPYGWRGGIGLHVFAVSLNLEYQDLTYNSTDVQSFGSLPVNQSSGIDFSDRGYTLSVSFPIEL